MQRDLLQNHKNILSTITRHTVYLTLIFMPYTFFQCMKAYRNSKSHIFVLAPALKCVYTTQIEAKDVHKGLISVADRNIRGADCGESSHGDVVLGPLEIRAHVESRHHTYTHTRVTVKTRLETRGHSKPEEQKDIHIRAHLKHLPDFKQEQKINFDHDRLGPRFAQNNCSIF